MYTSRLTSLANGLIKDEERVSARPLARRPFFFPRLRLDGFYSKHLSQRDAVPALSSMRLAVCAGRVRASRMKRLIDVVGAACGLIMLSPLFLIAAVLVKLDSRGPVFFRQERHGLDRKPFMMFKFRSMSVMEAHGAFSQATRNDARITRVGRILRKSSIDELPQLLNVLCGDMSLVGPRPHAIEMDKRYALILPTYYDRCAVRPGLTGLAQIDGLRGPTDTLWKITSRVRRDRAYIATWSIWRDLRIIVATPFRLFDENAH